MTEPGSMKPLTDALVGGFLSFTCLLIPIIGILSEPNYYSNTLSCQTNLQCIANLDVDSVPD